MTRHRIATEYCLRNLLQYLAGKFNTNQLTRRVRAFQCLEVDNMFKKATEIAIPLALTLFAGAAQAVTLGTNGDLESGAFDGSWVVFPNGGTTTIVSPGSNASGPASNFAGQASAAGGPFNPVMKFANVGAGLLTPGQAFTVDFDWKGTNGAGGVIDIVVFSELAAGGVSKTDLLAGGTGAGLTTSWTNFGVQNLTAGPDVSGGVTVSYTHLRAHET